MGDRIGRTAGGGATSSLNHVTSNSTRRNDGAGQNSRVARRPSQRPLRAGAHSLLRDLDALATMNPTQRMGRKGAEAFLEAIHSKLALERRDNAHLNRLNEQVEIALGKIEKNYPDAAAQIKKIMKSRGVLMEVAKDVRQPVVCRKFQATLILNSRLVRLDRLLELSPERLSYAKEFISLKATIRTLEKINNVIEINSGHITPSEATEIANETAREVGRNVLLTILHLEDATEHKDDKHNEFSNSRDISFCSILTKTLINLYETNNYKYAKEKFDNIIFYKSPELKKYIDGNQKAYIRNSCKEIFDFIDLVEGILKNENVDKNYYQNELDKADLLGRLLYAHAYIELPGDKILSQGSQVFKSYLEDAFYFVKPMQRQSGH